MAHLKYLWRLLTGTWVQCSARYTLSRNPKTKNCIRPYCQKAEGHFGPHVDSMGEWKCS